MPNKRILDEYKDLQPLIQKEATDIAKKIVKETLQNYKFSAFQTPNHVHNGVDSPELVLQGVSYIGVVPFEGPYDKTTSYQFALPGGWTAEKFATGVYIITHNLGNVANSNFYSISTQPITSTGEIPVSVVSFDNDEFIVSWFDSASQSAADTSFMFQLTTGNNRAPFRPQYLTANIA